MPFIQDDKIAALERDCQIRSGLYLRGQLKDYMIVADKIFQLFLDLYEMPAYSSELGDVNISIKDAMAGISKKIETVKAALKNKPYRCGSRSCELGNSYRDWFVFPASWDPELAMDLLESEGLRPREYQPGRPGQSFQNEAVFYKAGSRLLITQSGGLDV